MGIKGYSSSESQVYRATILRVLEVLSIECRAVLPKSKVVVGKPIALLRNYQFGQLIHLETRLVFQVELQGMTIV